MVIGAVNTAVVEVEVNDNDLDLSYLSAAARNGSLDLEQAADAILAAEGVIGHETGIYTQSQLDRRIRLEKRHLPVLDEGTVENDTIECLLRRQVDDLVEVSRLTPIQEICYRLYIDGLNCRDMSSMLRLKYHTTAHHLRSARKKVREAVRDGRYAGWYEVYLSEVNRRGCRSGK